MTLYSRFFGGPEGSVPEYTQPQFAEVLAKIFSNGVFSGIGDDFAVVENDPVSLSVVVGAGEAWIQGFWCQNTEADIVKTLAAADPDNDRIDRIVLRLDTTTNFKISVEVLTGTPGAVPEAPALTQTAAIYEISLAQVLVAEDATSVSDTEITDERDYVEVTYAPVTLTNTATLTNKRITKREATVASSATPTPNADTTDIYTITALAAAAEFGAPTGTPTQGQALIIRIKDNSTIRELTWNAIYRASSDLALPTTTVDDKTMYLGFIYNDTDSKWDLVAYLDNI